MSVCVWGLFRYLTQLPPLPPTHIREGIVIIKDGGDIPAGLLTLFSMLAQPILLTLLLGGMYAIAHNRLW